MTFFHRIADLIRAEKDAIVRRWREEARATSPARQLTLSDRELDDHLPVLLDDLTRTMCGEPTPSVEDAGAKHGRQRRELGYDVVDCLCELHLFRRMLLDAIEAHRDVIASASIDDLTAMRRTLLDLLDRSIQASMRQYMREAEGERDRAYARLEVLNGELQASHDQKDRFLAMLAHELRNPLAPIVTSVNLLKMPELPPERRQRACEIIERQTQYQKRLIDDLLAGLLRRAGALRRRQARAARGRRGSCGVPAAV